MQYSIYETILNNNKFPMNAFVISLDSVTWHWHNHYEMIGILTGSAVVRIQAEEYVLHAGDLMMINPREVHSLLKKEDGECLCMILQLAEEMFSDGNEDDEEKTIRFYLNSSDEDEPECGYGLFFYRMSRILYETIHQGKVSVFRVRAQVCSLIADLFEYTVYDKRIRDRGDKNQQNMLIDVIEYLEKHLIDQDILEHVCLEFGVSRKTLDRVVGGILGISSKELLDNLRIEKAKELIRFSTKNTGYIMDICGYSSENTFYRSFKKNTGMTPKEYKESIALSSERDELKGYLDYETPKVVSILKEIIQQWENRNYRV